VRETKRLRVTLVYEYDVCPEDYPHGNDPLAMAHVDIETDPAVILDADWTIRVATFAVGKKS
jgi:hypothetical protein